MKKSKLRKLIVSVLCVALCLAMGITALADYTWDMPISFVVTAEMLPTPTPTPTFVVPTATPKPTIIRNTIHSNVEPIINASHGETHFSTKGL